MAEKLEGLILVIKPGSRYYIIMFLSFFHSIQLLNLISCLAIKKHYLAT